MARTIILFALALAIAVGALEWLEYRHVTRTFPTQTYILLLAIGFTGPGLWAGRCLTARPAAALFERNRAAIRLGKIAGEQGG